MTWIDKPKFRLSAKLLLNDFSIILLSLSTEPWLLISQDHSSLVFWILLASKFLNLTRSNNCASISPTKNFNNFSTISCSFLNKKSTKKKVSNGLVGIKSTNRIVSFFIKIYWLFLRNYIGENYGELCYDYFITGALVRISSISYHLYNQYSSITSAWWEMSMEFIFLSKLTNNGRQFKEVKEATFSAYFHFKERLWEYRT